MIKILVNEIKFCFRLCKFRRKFMSFKFGGHGGAGTHYEWLGIGISIYE